MRRAFLKVYPSKTLKDGTCTVYVGIGNGTELYLSSGITVRPDEWDPRTQMCLGKNARAVNNALSAVLLRVNGRILELKERGLFGKLTTAQLRQMLQDTQLDEPPTSDRPTLGVVFRRVIAAKGKRNAQLFTETLGKLSQRCDPDKTDFVAINRTWLTGFDASMQGLAANTRAIHMRNLRNVINAAIDDGITQNYPFRRYRIRTEDTAMRVLPVESMRWLATADTLDRAYREYRDMFMLSFYLIGINICDLSRLTTESIVGGRIEYRRAKTGKLYSIRIEPEAQAIIDRWRGDRHLLACFDRYQNYKDYTKRINAALGRIGPPVIGDDGKAVMHGNNIPIMRPVEPRLSTYWARYSWATYAARLDIPKDTISESLGHEYGSRVTGVYIQFGRDKVDAANRRVIDWVLNGA